MTQTNSRKAEDRSNEETMLYTSTKYRDLQLDAGNPVTSAYYLTG